MKINDKEAGDNRFFLKKQYFVVFKTVSVSVYPSYRIATPNGVQNKLDSFVYKNILSHLQHFIIKNGLIFRRIHRERTYYAA